MKIKFTQILCGLVLASSSVFAQKTQPMAVWPIKSYESAGTELTQTKNGLIIEVEPLSFKSVYNHPEMYSFTFDQLDQLFMKSWSINVQSMWAAEYQGKHWQYTFGLDKNFLTVFKIKITNNTGHIIKMSDARILLRIEGEDPIKPVTKLGDPTIVMVTSSSGNAIPLPVSASTQDKLDNSLIQWVTGIENEYVKNRNQSFLTLEYPIGMASQVIAVNKKAYKLIANADVEIFPEDTYSGVLLFPVLVGDPISLRLYEFVTKTDAAGNPTEKTNFDFKFQVAEEKTWLNRNEQKWEIGNPPAEVEYYNKKEKKWYWGEPQK